MIEDLKLEELVNVINEYIRDNYEYDYADILEDQLICHLGNKTFYITISLEKTME